MSASVDLETSGSPNQLLKDYNQNKSDQLESIFTDSIPSGLDQEASPVKKNPIPKAKLVIPTSLLYSGIDGSLYDLDSLPVPFVTKGPAAADAAAVHVQAQPALPQPYDQKDAGDSAPKSPCSKAVGSVESLSDSPALEGQLPQQGTYTSPSGQTGGWTADGIFIPMYSRKEKSLGLLCDK